MTFDPLALPPLLTADLPGIGGRIKTVPEDFEVEEVPAYAPSGAGALTVGEGTDVGDFTASRERELELSRLAAIVSSSDDAIISKTLDGKILSWNAGATSLFGYEATDMIGQSIFRIIPPELYEEEKQILNRLRQGERIHHYETARVAKDGRRIEISLTVSPLFNKYERVIGASKVARDITTSREAEAELQRVRTELARVARVTTLGELTAAIAHEVNQPLAAIVTNGAAGMRWLGADPPNVERARESMTRMISEGNRASEIIKRIRTLSKKAAQHKFQLENSCARHGARLFDGAGDERGGRFTHRHFAHGPQTLGIGRNRRQPNRRILGAYRTRVVRKTQTGGGDQCRHV